MSLSWCVIRLFCDDCEDFNFWSVSRLPYCITTKSGNWEALELFPVWWRFFTLHMPCHLKMFRFLSTNVPTSCLMYFRQISLTNISLYCLLMFYLLFVLLPCTHKGSQGISGNEGVWGDSRLSLLYSFLTPFVSSLFLHYPLFFEREVLKKSVGDTFWIRHEKQEGVMSCRRAPCNRRRNPFSSASPFRVLVLPFLILG